MNLALPPHVQRLIDERVRSGRYKTAEDVVAAAVATLQQQEHAGDFAPGEMEGLLQEGEQGGDALDGEQVLAEVRRRRGRSQPRRN